MAFFELLLVLLSLAVLVTELLDPPHPPWLAWIPVVATPVLLFHLAVDGYRVLLVPTYLVLLWSLLHAVADLLGDTEDEGAGGEKPGTTPRRHSRTVLIGVGIGAVLVTSLLARVLNPVVTVQSDITTLVNPSTPRDFSALPWVAAFDSTLTTLRREYPYTDWKGIQWDSIRARIWPRLAAAQARGDAGTYRSIVADFVRALPDAGVTVTARGTDSLPTPGTFGLRLARTDSATVVVLAVGEPGPAARAGLQPGDTILRWNELPIDSALSAVPDSVQGHRAVTTRARDAFTLDAIGNARPGTRVRLTLANQRQVDLVAEALPPGEVLPGDSLAVSHRLLPDSVGHLRIRAFAPSLRQWLPASAVQAAVRSFRSAGARGVIVDLRGHPTGFSRKLAAAYAGPFTPQTDLMEEMSLYQTTTGSFAVDPRRTLWVRPGRPRWEGPVVVLVDRWCAGPCEGLAMLLSRVPRTTVLGWAGTAGSFGLPGGAIDLPEGLRLRYPLGRSLDASGSIQLEADTTGRGGVPTTRPPRPRASLPDSLAPGTDPLLEEARRLLHTPAPDSLSSGAWRPAPDPDTNDKAPPTVSGSHVRAPDAAVSPAADTGMST